jgi:hypothetical protein
MTDWTSGYVADIGYTFGTYSELNPLRLKLAFLHAGLAFPDNGVACELGFGQGMSVNIHAAATVTEWHGTDFNPTQAGFAQELARASCANARLYDQSFEQFCTREDLPEFDFIGLHGIWSWISDENRSIIVDFVRRKLKVGGVLYISYNTMQGWATMVPVREMMTEHSSVMAAPGKNILPRVEESLNFLDRLFATSPAYLKANPGVQPRLDNMKKMSRNYVAHEYFNRDWLPMSFSAMAKWLAPAKLSFACSAHYPDQIDMINFTPEQSALLKEIDDVHFAQTVRDFMLNQQFRRDYWVRGPRPLRTLQRHELLMAQNVMLVVTPDKVQYKLTTPLGELQLQENIYKPVVEFLAGHQARTIGQIAEVCLARGVNAAQVIQAVFLLVGLGYAQAVQPADAIALAKPQTDRLNRQICEMAKDSADVAYLASPATGGAIIVQRFPQLFLLSKANGAQRPEQWAAFASATLSRTGARLVLQGKPVESEEEQLRELTRMAQEFAEREMPVLQALGVAF